MSLLVLGDIYEPDVLIYVFVLRIDERYGNKSIFIPDICNFLYSHILGHENFTLKSA